jgi:hypothetical protein
MVYFRHGIVGPHPATRPKRKPQPRPKPITEPSNNDDVVIEVVNVDDVHEDENKVEDVEVVIVEEIEESPKKKFKDMTPEEKKAFYKARAAKACATRALNKATEASS